MKVLFTCVPGFGHFHPLVPLADALRRAGHEVAFATAERFCRRVVEPAGFLAFPAGLSPHVVHEQTLELPGIGDQTEEDVWRFGARMFAEVAAPAKVPDLIGVVKEWAPDLLVHDMTDFAGPVAAAACDVPLACQSFGALQPDQFWDVAARAVAPTWKAWAVEPGPSGGMFDALYLDLCPPSFQSAVIERVPVSRLMRPVAFDNPNGDELPAWVRGLPEGPTIYVTLGTVANHTPQVFETVIAAVAGQPVDVVVTVGPDRDPGGLGPLPPNVHVEHYLPQSLLFPSCDLVVCHGGSGTTLAALAFGLPLLVLPQEANQFWNADRTAALGAGELVRPDELTAAAVQGAVARLLGDPSYRERAGSLAAEIAAMPSPQATVGPLEKLVQGAEGGQRRWPRSRKSRSKKLPG